MLDADHRGDGYLSGQASPGHFQVTSQNALMVDWPSLIDQWLMQIAGRAVRSGLFSIPAWPPSMLPAARNVPSIAPAPALRSKPWCCSTIQLM